MGNSPIIATITTTISLLAILTPSSSYAAAAAPPPPPSTTSVKAGVQHLREKLAPARQDLNMAPPPQGSSGGRAREGRAGRKAGGGEPAA